VQHLSLACVPPPANLTIAPVTPAQTFLLFSSSTGGVDYNTDDGKAVRLVDSTTVAVTRGNASCGIAPETWSLQVVDFAGATVTHGVVAGLSSGTLVTSSFSPAVDLTRSFVLYTYGLSSTGAGGICPLMVRAELSTTQVSFRRGSGRGICGSSDQLLDLSYEVVQLPAGALVRSERLEPNSGDLTLTASFVAGSVAPERSFVLTGGGWTGGQGFGETDYSADDTLGVAVGLLELSAGGAGVTVTRLLATGRARFEVFAVQLP
jgi:hypothetical protein